MIKKIVIATRNTAKINHYREVLSGLVELIIGLNDLNIQGKPEEVGDSAETNAEIKAKFYSQQTDLPIFSEDECLYADFLSSDQQPGTHVRRINGQDDATDDELLSYWENKIQSVSEDKRTGRWHFAYCLIDQGKIKIATKDVPIKFYYPSSKIRVPGWPLSSITGSFGKPHSEYTDEENRIHQKLDKKILKPILRQLLKNSK